jgi:uncharacterized protein YlxW (UPF0749 family)
MTLETELKDAKAQETHLLRKIGNIRPHEFESLATYRQEREKLEVRHRKLSAKRATLETEYDKAKIAETVNETKALIEDKLQLLRIEIYGRPLPIDGQALTTTLSFSNCEHTEKVSLSALIPFEKQRLWQDVLKDGLSVTLSRNCPHCRAEKANKLKLHRLYDKRPIGHASVTVRGLH